MPDNTAYIFSILHVLLAYGRHLSLTLERRSTAWGFSVIAQFFGTARLPVIRARLARGILRIMALQRVLLSRAVRGRDTKFLGKREPREKPAAPPSAGANAAPPPSRPKRTRRCYADTVPDLDNLPTLKQLEAAIRRRSVGAALVDICRDLGVPPNLCEGRFWNALYAALVWTNGNLCTLVQDLRRHQREFEPELRNTPPLCLPETSRDGIRRMLGFFIGERWPVMPNPHDAPLGTRVLPAARPP